MINDSAKYLVIRKYGDQLICKDYDYSNKKLGKQTIIVKIPINKPVVLISYRIGNWYERSILQTPTLPTRKVLKYRRLPKVNPDSLKH